VMWPKLGHLAHEEDPALCVALIVDVLRKVGVSATASPQAAVV
jgi:hypothetical protein